MACKFHPDRESAAICVTCGAELCEECRRIGADGRSYCAEHLPQEIEMPPRAAIGATAAAGGTTESTGLAAACYFSWVLPPLSFIIPIVPLASASYKGSRYMRYHAYSGLFWGLALVVLTVVLGLIHSLAGFAPLLGAPMRGLLRLLMYRLLPLAWLVLSILFAIKASNRQKANIPVISDLAEKQAR